MYPQEYVRLARLRRQTHRCFHKLAEARFDSDSYYKERYGEGCCIHKHTHTHT